MTKKIKEKIKNVRLLINKLGAANRRKKIQNQDVTIISNNCYAEIIYQYLGLKYNSPTIGLYFFAEEYIRFLENFKYYINKKLTFINIKNSKYYDELKKNKHDNAIIGKLEDIEIVFLQYKSEKEALEKWEKRCKRINFENIIFKFNDQNLCNDKLIERFDMLEVKNKICFTSKKYENSLSNVWIQKYKDKKCIKEDYYSGHRYFDIIQYINNLNHNRKVLHLVSTSIFSGAENVVCQIIKAFSNDTKFDMAYCSTVGKNQTVLEEKNIKWIKLNNFSIRNLKKVVREYRPTIIHAHDIRASLLATFFYRDCKIISHIHANHENMRKFNVKTFLYNLVSQRVNNIIWISKSALDNYYFKNKILSKSIVLYNVIDENEVLKKAELDKQKYGYDIIYLGRITYQKDPLRLIEVIENVKKIKNDIKVAIIGDGDLLSKCVEEISKKGLENNIKMYSFLSNPYKILKNSKIMLMTSRYEGTPMCALEAITFGKPIISTPTDGLVDLIENEKTGFLSNDNDRLVNYIVELLEDSNKYNIISDNVKKLSKRVNDVGGYKQKLEEVYCDGDKNEKN